MTSDYFHLRVLKVWLLSSSFHVYLSYIEKDGELYLTIYLCLDSQKCPENRREKNLESSDLQQHLRANIVQSKGNDSF